MMPGIKPVLLTLGLWAFQGFGARAQNVSVALGFDTVTAPAQGRLYLSSIAAFRNGNTLRNNTVTFRNLDRTFVYQIRMLVNNNLTASSITFPASQIRINVTGIRLLTNHNFRNPSTVAGNLALGTPGAVPTITNGIELGRFEVIGGGGDGAQVEMGFNLICLPNNATNDNLVPGDNVTPRAYTGMTLTFSLWRQTSPTTWVEHGRATPSPAFTIGIRNAIELVLGSTPALGFRIQNTAMIRSGQTIIRNQHFTVSSNRPYNVTAFATANLSSGANTRQIPASLIRAQVTTTGVGALGTAQTLGLSGSPAALTNNTPLGLDRVFNAQYNIISDKGLLVPGSSYNTNLVLSATQL